MNFFKRRIDWRVLQAKSQGTIKKMFCDLDVCFINCFGCACSKQLF